MPRTRDLDNRDPNLADREAAPIDLDSELRYLSEIRILSFDEERKMAEVELLPQGKWRRPQGSGWFEVSKSDLGEFIKNFKSGITGRELPLDFGHSPDSKQTPGWIVDMYSKPNSTGQDSIYAKLQITEPETWDRIKQKSLKYISPQIVFGWVEPRSNSKFDVIKSAALTNYPYIKNMEPMKILNFEEVQNREEGSEKVKYKEFMAKLEEIEALELEDEEQEKKLEALFEEYGIDLQDTTVAKAKRGEDTNYETEAEKKKKEEEEKKKKEEEAKMQDKGRPYYKATSRPYYKATSRPYEKGKTAQAEDDRLKDLAGGVPAAEFAEKEKELKGRILKLEEQLESGRVDKIISGYQRSGKLLPGLAPIVKAILMKGQTMTLNFEDKDTNVRDLVIRYFDEAPKVIDFEDIAAQELEDASTKSLDKMSQAELNSEAEKIAKEEGIRFEEALDKVTEKHFKAPK